MRKEPQSENTHVRQKSRKQLAVGNVYRFKGYRGDGFKIVGMSLPGTPSDDGVLPGVAIQWLNHSKHSGWYVFHSEADFWRHSLFSNACDPEDASEADSVSDDGKGLPPPGKQKV